MAFGESVTAETFELPEGLLGKIPLVTVRHHARDQLFTKFGDAAGMLECGHGAAELVCFAWREARTFDRDAHRLFLEQWHSQRLAEHAFKLRLGIDDLLLSLSASQIGMDHVALDRARPHDRNLDDKVIESARLD